MLSLLDSDYLNIPLRAHPQKVLSSDPEHQILVLNSGERIYFFDIRIRIQSGCSGLVKTIKRSEILDAVSFGEGTLLHPRFLQRVMLDSTKDESTVLIMKVLSRGTDFFAAVFENGQAVVVNPQNNTNLVYLNPLLTH